jgi:sugar phosphate isomerase/epimerase
VVGNKIKMLFHFHLSNGSGVSYKTAYNPHVLSLPFALNFLQKNRNEGNGSFNLSISHAFIFFIDQIEILWKNISSTKQIYKE